jgi:hypothetical protein
MPHEGSDVFYLPAPGAMALYFTCEFDSRQKLIWQLHGLKLAKRQGGQLFAQALQGPVFIFFPGSAFIIRIHFAVSLPFRFTQHQYPLKFSSGCALAFFPPKNGLPHNSVDFAPKLLHYLPWCGNGRVHSGA